MPKRTDIKKILIIGAGPIIIGQACEFDYSGTQACKALKEDGFEIVLINSNPATIMTDPEMADRTYIEPITVEIVAKIIAKERPQAILPTLGGQTGLNMAMDLAKQGVLKKFNVEMIGANEESIEKAENRKLFKACIQKIGLDLPKSGYATSVEEAKAVAKDIGAFPLILRPSFTLGGTGGGVAESYDEYLEMVQIALDASPVREVLIEESIIGWKEYELEVMRDKADNVVIICSIENFDPMGVHTGDSITVAPQQTLSDKEYQLMRDAAIQIIREIGVETGGSNIQFGVNPTNGRMVVIEMNPRVSRSSALASKATGFPIAKIAAKLAVGYTLNELTNDITKETPASFEPTIDYCVVKLPRFTFEKFPGANTTLTTKMKSVGETMSIGRTFKEAFQKAIRSLETGYYGFGSGKKVNDANLIDLLKRPNANRLQALYQALQKKMTIEELYKLTYIDPWFLNQMKDLVELDKAIENFSLTKKIQDLSRDELHWIKSNGISDRKLAELFKMNEVDVRKYRVSQKVEPGFRLVDTCAAEFEAYTPYYYSSYDVEDESRPNTKKKSIMILGGGPNRIGQGIEFDYCCVHAVFALKELGYETIMVNSNPETVSTDYDTSDKLYFEPLTAEDVLAIYRKENCQGVIVQFGGQTPLNLADKLEQEGCHILGTSTNSIDLAEDRGRFQNLIERLSLRQPANGMAKTAKEALNIAERIGYPVVVRPSYVLGGRAMRIVYDDKMLEEYMSEQALEITSDKPILIDKYLESATEVDVDAISDGHDVVIGAIMEHIEEAGIHSGDSACVIPSFSLSQLVLDEIREATRSLALGLKVEGLINIQFAVQKEQVYVLEVNPRASRTVPFVSKSIGVPLAKLATKLMVGKKLTELGFMEEVHIPYFSVKEAVLPFDRFSGVDTILGPEMKSTGEVMGIDYDYGLAFAKAQFGAKQFLPLSGKVFISVKDIDKIMAVKVAKMLSLHGFNLIATPGTADYLSQHGLQVEKVGKIKDTSHNILAQMKSRKIHLVINTPSGKGALSDDRFIRMMAVSENIPYFTTMAGALACAKAIESLKKKSLEVLSIQEYHQALQLTVEKVS